MSCSEETIAGAGRALATVYTAVSALCAGTVLLRLLTAKFCHLPFHLRHAAFLLLLLLLFVGRVASDIWELGDGRLVAAGSSRWMYNLLSTGPVVIFLTIFLVLLYHLTCVLHSISLAKQNLEAAYSRSVAFHGERSLERSVLHPPQRCCCRPRKTSLSCFWKIMLITIASLWVLFFTGYAATLLVQDDGKQHLSLALTALVEAPIFVVCALTGLGLLVFAIQLLRRLRRLRWMLRNEQVIAALRAGAATMDPVTFSSEGSTEEVYVSQRSSSTAEPMMPTLSASVNANAESEKESEAPPGQASARCSRSETGSFSSGSSATTVPKVESVLGSVSRVLAVVTACVGAFLFRAGCILYLVCTDQQYWPCGLLFPYYLISEVAPAALLILLYLLPGLEVACFREGARAGSRSTGRPSMLESEVSALQATFSMRWSVSSARPLVAEA
ncbi:unnamed protein product [Durusdinium trenchii]|uniref:Uncharacterized protein n=1 Tax=Durusdinium trenchii TaxID=1381693 RepID=A0ABP0R4L4_9DINO